MTLFPQLILHKQKVDAVKRFHPWIFSGAIKRREADVTDGDVVEVYSETGEYLATGYYSTGSIAVKILSFQKVQDLQTLFVERLQAAYSLRQKIGFAQNPTTTCYRLINSEGDGLPGIILDWYDGTAVLQAHSAGAYAHRHYLLEALQIVYGTDLKAVYDKSGSTLSKKSQLVIQDSYLIGQASDTPVLENNHSFLVDWETGQKTGFFLDQRDNRQLFARYATEKKVLNTFCYSGGFSVYAIAAGARSVDSVDSSAKAIEWTEANVQLNNSLSKQAAVSHQAVVQDVFSFLKDCDADYELIVLDPPAFAKSLSARHQAMQAYKRLNLQALHKLKKGGILFTFSCSQVVGLEHFTGAVTAAAIASGRSVRLLHHLSQPADHPTSIFHPEGAYLKGLVLEVR